MKALQTARSDDAETPGSGRARWLVLAVGAMAVIVVGGLFAGGELQSLAGAGIEIFPLILLGALLQLAINRPWAKGVAWIGFWLILLAIGLVSIGLTVAALNTVAMGEATVPQVTSESRILIILAIFLAALITAIVLVATGWWYRLDVALGGRLNRASTAHAMGVVGLVYFILLALAPLVALGGLPPLLELVTAEGSGFSLDRGGGGVVVDMFYSLAWMIPLALIGAGLPVRRTLQAGLARLGIRPLSLGTVVILAVVAAVLVGVALALDAGISALFAAAGWPATDQHALEQLFKGTSSLAGALAVGITAGIGEELIARGLFQTRFGWLLPNLAFAAAHGYQYGWDALISVFVVGSVLAFVRHRWSTSGSAFVHGSYNFLLVVGGLLSLPGF